MFIRGSRRIYLTGEGMILRKRAEESTSLVGKTETEIMESNDDISSDVYIGSCETERLRLSPEDLWELPLIVSQQVENNEYLGWMKRDKEQLNIAATYNLLYNASLIVEEGVGYAICLDKLIKVDENQPLRFVCSALFFPIP